MRAIAGRFLNDCIAGGFRAILFAVKRRKKTIYSLSLEVILKMPIAFVILMSY